MKTPVLCMIPRRTHARRVEVVAVLAFRVFSRAYRPGRKPFPVRRGYCVRLHPPQMGSKRRAPVSL